VPGVATAAPWATARPAPAAGLARPLSSGISASDTDAGASGIAGLIRLPRLGQDLSGSADHAGSATFSLSAMGGAAGGMPPPGAGAAAAAAAAAAAGKPRQAPAPLVDAGAPRMPVAQASPSGRFQPARKRITSEPDLQRFLKSQTVKVRGWCTRAASVDAKPCRASRTEFQPILRSPHHFPPAPPRISTPASPPGLRGVHPVRERGRDGQAHAGRSGAAALARGGVAVRHAGPAVAVGGRHPPAAAEPAVSWQGCAESARRPGTLRAFQRRGC
jgi:hypothetical protein